MSKKLYYQDGKYHAVYQSPKTFAAALEAKKFLEDKGWKFLGFSANEALFTTSAFKEVNGLVFTIADADDDFGKGLFEDNFSHPSAMNRCCQVLVYQRPFLPSDFDKEEWMMDGSHPIHINDENREVTAPCFRTLEEAVEFCDWISNWKAWAQEHKDEPAVKEMLTRNPEMDSTVS